MNGNCSAALRVDSYNISVDKKCRVNVILEEPLNLTASLKSVNVGSGTTGTRGLNAAVCEGFGIKTIHYALECNSELSDAAIQQWSIAIIICANEKHLNCRSDDLLSRYPAVLKSLVTNYAFASDFPIGEILPDVIQLVPDITIVATLRPPSAWTTRRFEEHANTVVCHPSLWTDNTVLHPFDIISCLRLKQLVHHAVVPIAHFRRLPHGFDMIRNAFIQFNSFNYHLAQSTRRPYLPLCLWDSQSTGKQDLHNILSHFWETYPTTSSLVTALEGGGGGSGTAPREVKGLGRYILKKRARLLYGTVSQTNSDTTRTHRYLSVGGGGGALSLSLHSNCSKAFLVDSHTNQTPPPPSTLAPRFGLSISSGLLPRNITLKSLNVGPGTTGTRTVNTVVCQDLSVATIHWYSVCNNHTADLTVQRWASRLYKCTYQRRAKCPSSELLLAYPNVLGTILTQFEYASDFPIGEMLSDILPYVPNLSVLMTVRDPDEWALRRQEVHRRTPICSRVLWDHPNVLHPFDIIGCLHSAQFVHEALIPVSTVPRDVLREGFVRYNTAVLGIIEQHRLPFLPICLWDHHSSSSSDLVRMLREFWRLSPDTVDMADREGEGQAATDPVEFAPKRIHRGRGVPTVRKIGRNRGREREGEGKKSAGRRLAGGGEWAIERIYLNGERGGEGGTYWRDNSDNMLSGGSVGWESWRFLQCVYISGDSNCMWLARGEVRAPDSWILILVCIGLVAVLMCAVRRRVCLLKR